MGIVLDGSGNLYVTGRSWNGSNYDMVIWKYDGSGNPDASFGTGGIVMHHNAEGLGIVLDSLGNPYVTGRSIYDMVIWKYDGSGNPDASFGTGGIVMHNNAAGGNGYDYGMGIVLDGLGNLYVTGYSWNGSNTDMVIWKYQ